MSFNSTWNAMMNSGGREQLARKARRRIRRLREAEEGDAGSSARGLSKRLRSIITQAIQGHPFTLTDRETCKEICAYLDAAAGPDEDEAEAEVPEVDDDLEESRRVPTSPAAQLAWLREGRQGPAPSGLRQPAAAQRNPTVSRHLADGTVPSSPDDQLRWLLS